VRSFTPTSFARKSNAAICPLYAVHMSDKSSHMSDNRPRGTEAGGPVVVRFSSKSRRGPQGSGRSRRGCRS
jgi:hypothetical protein